MKRYLLGSIVGLSLMALGAVQAKADVLFDFSPDALGGISDGNWSNISNSQNFLVAFTLTDTATIGGMDIYSGYQGIEVGQSVTIRLRNDASGQPDSTNAYKFTTTIDAIDTDGASNDPGSQRFHADFDAITLSAGTYWIGMSGTNTEIGWDSVAPALDPPQWQLSDDDLSFPPNINPLAFRIDGATSVPAPGALALLGLGLAGFGGLRRRTKAA